MVTSSSVRCCFAHSTNASFSSFHTVSAPPSASCHQNSTGLLPCTQPVCVIALDTVYKSSKFPFLHYTFFVSLRQLLAGGHCHANTHAHTHTHTQTHAHTHTHSLPLCLPHSQLSPITDSNQTCRWSISNVLPWEMVQLARRVCLFHTHAAHFLENIYQQCE